MIDLWFPSCVYRIDKLDNNNIKNQISVLEKHSEFVRTEFNEVDSSYDIKDVHNNTEFESLFSKINYHIDQFRKELGYTKKIIIHHSWFNVSFNGDYVSQHIHPGSIISGAYYLECNSVNDKIFFHKNNDMTLPPDNLNPLNFKSCEYECTVDRLLLFKSNLPHSTSKQKGKRKIVLSFNTKFDD